MIKKVLILNDGSAYKNWGIKACIDGLRHILQVNSLDVEIDTIDHNFMHKIYRYEPAIYGHLLFTKDSRISKRVLTPFHILPKVVDEFEYIADLWMSGKGGEGANIFIHKAQKADYIIFNAEGSAYKNNIGAIKGLFMLWFAKTRLHKKVIFMNGSVTLTLVDPILPAMIKKVISEIDLFIVREPYSYKSIATAYPNLEKKVYMYPDSVFALNIDEKMSQKIKNLEYLKEDFFVFSSSMLPFDYVKTRKKSSIVSLINHLKTIVPNVVMLAKDSEDQVLKNIAEDTGSYFIGSDFSYQEVMLILSKASFLVSGRYHHLIFATKVGCPVIPLITSSHKIHGLSRLFEGLIVKPLDVTDLWNTSEKILDEAKKIVKDKGLRKKYREKAKELKEKSLNQSRLIFNIK